MEVSDETNALMEVVFRAFALTTIGCSYKPHYGVICVQNIVFLENDVYCSVVTLIGVSTIGSLD